MTKPPSDPFSSKGAVEQDRPGQPTNVSERGQLPHRTEDPLIKSSDSDFPEPGETPEHSGEPQGEGTNQRDRGCGS